MVSKQQLLPANPPLVCLQIAKNCVSDCLLLLAAGTAAGVGRQQDIRCCGISDTPSLCCTRLLELCLLGISFFPQEQSASQLCRGAGGPNRCPDVTALLCRPVLVTQKLLASFPLGVATETKEACVAWMVSLLNFLGLQGYQVLKKAQVVKQKVIYLGYEVSARQRASGQDRKEAICQTPKPETIKELQTFLGMTGWCRLWIYNYGLLVKPLYALTANGNRNLQWTKEATRAFDQLKKALMSAPALGLPDVNKPFFLFSHEKLPWEY